MALQDNSSTPQTLILRHFAVQHKFSGVKVTIFWHEKRFVCSLCHGSGLALPYDALVLVIIDLDVVP